MLWISVTGDSVQWQDATPGDPGDPDARAEHSAVMEPTGKRMLASGGDTGSAQSSNEVWALDLTWEGVGSNFDPTWTLQSSATSVALSGHTAIGDLIEYQALEPEIYDPTQPAGNRWSTLTNAPKRYAFYPYVFQLPSGNVAMMGPDNIHWLLKLNSNPIVWDYVRKSDSSPAGPHFWGRSAVMYQPGKIMKCGIADESWTLSTDVIEFDPVSDLTGNGWIVGSGFADRDDHNLTILPDGRVIATGGYLDSTYIDGEGKKKKTWVWRQQPQIWDPEGAGGAGSWTVYGDLENEPETRMHHSASLLLPDGRVLSTDEAIKDDPPNPGVVTLYCPPYLFTLSTPMLVVL